MRVFILICCLFINNIFADNSLPSCSSLGCCDPYTGANNCDDDCVNDCTIEIPPHPDCDTIINRYFSDYDIENGIHRTEYCVTECGEAICSEFVICNSGYIEDGLCPDNGKMDSDVDINDKTKCYNTEFYNKKGNGIYTNKCYYSIDF